MQDSRDPVTEGQAQGSPRIIAFMNQKGGVGKTTTVVSLGAALARAGCRTLLIDLDPQAHVTLHLGVEPSVSDDGTPRAAYHLLLHEPAPYGSPIDPRATIVHARKHLALIPAITDQAAIETELADAPHRHQRLAHAIASLRKDYDFILIDCPPSLGLLTLNGLVAAQEVIMPMQSHFLALQGVGKLLETVRLISQQLNPALQVRGVVLAMHDEHTNHAKEVVADLRGFFDASRGRAVPWAHAEVLNPPIRRNIKLAECPSFGQTVFEYDPTCAGSNDYAELAEELLTQPPLPPLPAPAPSLEVAARAQAEPEALIEEPRQLPASTIEPRPMPAHTGAESEAPAAPCDPAPAAPAAHAHSDQSIDAHLI
ncbi:MAG: ParA family protein [Phycisphaerales bacterium]|nr:ParA family protein [Phycisphaerales bacterium]